MKRSLKDRITALGLSYQRELFVMFLIASVGVTGFLIFLLLVKQLIIAVMIIGASVIALYFYVSRYSSLERLKEKEHIDNFISLLSYFEIFISNGNNVYTAFKMLLPYGDMFIQDAISSLLSQIDVDKTIGPFINFASKFNDHIIESLMLSIYQMVDNGESVINLTEFDLIFNSIKEKHLDDQIENKRKSLDFFNSFPLIGAGAITIVLSISMISIVGDYINVI